MSRLKIQQVQSLHVDASQTVGNRHSGTESPRGACSCRPLSGRPAWPGVTQTSGSRGAPGPWRDGAHSLAGAGGPRAPALANAASSAALRNGTDGATTAVVSSEHKVASVPRKNNFPLHITSLPTLHHVTPRTQPFHFLTPHGRLGVTFALSCARSQQNGHETSHRATPGGRAEVGMDELQEGGSSVGGVKPHTPRPGDGEQHSSEVSNLRRQTPRQAKIGPCHSKERDGK